MNISKPDWGYWAICNDCQHKHPIRREADMLPSMEEWRDWTHKHKEHHAELFTGQASHDYVANANVSQADGSQVAFTITLASLATDANLLIGRGSASIARAANQVDARVAGKITLGTSPSAATVELWAYGDENGSAVYPDGITGTDAANTMTTRAIVSTALALIGGFATPATSNQAQWVKPVGLAALLGDSIPANYGVWVVHSTGVNLNSTGGNHAIYQTPVYYTVV
jgi:hypothetical protein